MWFRFALDGTATAGGLARTDAASFADEFHATLAAVTPAADPPAVRD
jgi:hypothetical protein